MSKFNKEDWHDFIIERCKSCGQLPEEDRTIGKTYEIIANEKGPQQLIARIYGPHETALFMQARELHELVKGIMFIAIPGFDDCEKVKLPPGWLEKAKKVLEQIEEI